MKNKIKTHLLKGNSLTAENAKKWWKCNRLARVICDLKNDRMKITTVYSFKKTKNGKVRIATYKLK